jgi:peptidyl-prolyl cis-trans isomerase SurA
MKTTIASILLCILVLPVIGAQSLDKPAATVRLTKMESIPVSQRQKNISAFEKQAGRSLTVDEKKQVLDTLVASILLSQAATRDGVSVSEAELKQYIAEAEAQVGSLANLGRPMTDDELSAYLKTQNLTFDAWKKTLRDTRLQTTYVMQKRKAMFDSVKPPTEADIQDFYDANKQRFFMNDMVSLKHIFVDTRQLTSKDDRDKAQKHAEDVLRELKGGASFNDLVMKYSEDTKTKYSGGSLGTLFRDNVQARQTLGASFFDSVFRMKKGETSGVLQSNMGFHIVVATERLDARLLSLDDKVPPDYKSSVRDVVGKAITANRQNTVFSSASADLVAELKKKAEVKIYDDNIGW